MDETRRNIIFAGSFLGAVFLAPILPAACSMMRKGNKIGAPQNPPPPRPSGEPEPLLDEDIGPILNRLDTWLQGNPATPVTLNPPAKEAELNALDAAVGRKLPSALRQLYRWHDGETLGKSSWGFLFGTEWLSTQHILGNWLQWQKTTAEFGSNRYPFVGAGWPKDAVDPAYTNPAWIPIASDGSSGHIGIDMDPWPQGRIGQIILFGRNEDVKAVIFPSLGTFLEWFVTELEAGNWVIEQRGQTPQLAHKAAVGRHIFDLLRQRVGAPGPF